MAGLSSAVYEHKLIPIRGHYELWRPVALLAGIGPVQAGRLAELGVRTVADFLRYDGPLPPRFPKGIRTQAAQDYGQLLR